MLKRPVRRARVSPPPDQDDKPMTIVNRLPTDPVAPPAETALDPVPGKAFRDCIARLPSGVHVITTAGPAGRGGFTATAVASVSDDPPTVLVCLNRQSSQNALFKTNGRFAVNLVPAGGREIADAFAGRTGLSGEDRFRHGAWTTIATGAPVLVGSVMSLDCLLAEAHEMGTHTVFFGTVVGCTVTPPSEGTGPDILIYHDRHYSDV